MAVCVDGGAFDVEMTAATGGPELSATEEPGDLAIRQPEEAGGAGDRNRCGQQRHPLGAIAAVAAGADDGGLGFGEDGAVIEIGVERSVPTAAALSVTGAVASVVCSVRTTRLRTISRN